MARFIAALVFLLLLQAGCSSAASSAGFSKVRAVSLGGWLVIEKWIQPGLFDGIPNNDMLDGREILLKSVKLGKFATAEQDGSVTVGRTSASTWETFKLWRVTSTQFQLRVSNNKFISAEQTTVDAKKDTPGPPETFTIERNPSARSKVHLKASNNMYLQAKDSSKLTADYSGSPGWENGNPAVFEMVFPSWPLGGDYQLGNGYGSARAAVVLKKHRDTFVQEADFAFLQSHGINAVRIPVGWWIAYDPNPPAPFVSGGLNALDNAFAWAKKYNLGVIIDLHAAPGCQNRWEHSGSRDGVPMWTQHIPETLRVIDFLTSRYAKHPALLGVELLNEPTAGDIPLSVLNDYYKQGYEIVRKHSPSAFVIMCQRIGSDPSELVNLMRPDQGYKNVVLDVHLYNMFSSIFEGKSMQWIFDFINVNKTKQVQDLNNAGGASIFIGEWTNEWDLKNAAQADYTKFGAAQLSVYGKASFGWSYWSLRNANLHWDFVRSVNAGFLPKAPWP